VLGSTGVLPVTDLDAIHGDPVAPVPVQERGALLHALTADTVEALLAEAGPGATSPLGIVELRQLDGALARPGPGAFSTGGAAFALTVIGLRTPDTGQVVADAADRLLAALAPWSTGRRLPNSGATGPVHDDAVLAGLREVVRRHDPRGVLLETDALR
jgi:hypothetical protein